MSNKIDNEIGMLAVELDIVRKFEDGSYERITENDALENFEYQFNDLSGFEENLPKALEKVEFLKEKYESINDEYCFLITLEYFHRYSNDCINIIEVFN